MSLALTLTERLGDPTLCAGISPQYHLSAVGIDGNTGMIVLVDGNKDFALRAVLVHRSDFKINGKKRSSSSFIIYSSFLLLLCIEDCSPSRLCFVQAFTSVTF
jgi:hypothetical protein